uniref:Integrin beta n=1 Tax=Culicoides sonorensis TaxID=179676 RepID=A0A336MVT2_CULSO
MEKKKITPHFKDILTYLVILFVIHIQFVQSQSIDCSKQISCRDCIQTEGCAWCPKLTNDDVKCFKATEISKYCDPSSIENPKNKVNISQDTPLTKNNSKSNKSIVQLKPQQIDLKLRIKEPKNITFEYARAEDYPVDLYNLMDLSYSMNYHKDKLSRLGSQVASEMSKITKNFRLGFGSFVDKTTYPYISVIPEGMNKSQCQQCAEPYSFKHHMSLSNDSALFEKRVREAKISGNVDPPEGGLDALMQVMVCENEIGWRPNARRLVVFSTDASFHYAGDGKLGGVIKPNDGKCHMKNNEYTHGLIQDYPSVGQINEIAKKHAINIIFAVTTKQIKVYQTLSEHIEGSTVSTLANDSSNVVSLIRDQYNKISSSIEIKDNADKDILNVKYFSKCLGDKINMTNKCDGLKVGQTVEFQVEFTAISCPKNPSDWKQTVKIYPVGIDESLIITIELQCDCTCEKSVEHKSPICSNHGSLTCGICECNEGFSGRDCKCSVQDESTSTENDLQCRPDNMTKVECNNQGNCICGLCECYKRANPHEIISGKYCECDNFSCKRHDGFLCSGQSHGTCKCGVCDCKPGWIGSACECSTSTDTCRAPGETEICSGYGECICGQCKCSNQVENNRYGRFCEKCPTCPGRCQDFKECVQCLAYNTGPLATNSSDCDSNCEKLFKITSKTETVAIEKENLDEQLCTFYDENQCRFQFVYNDKDANNVVVRVQEILECPPKVFTPAIIFSIVGSIVLVGLASLLLWKLIMTIQYKNEFAKFEKERLMACWDTGENPLYKKATSTYQNPLFREE